MKNFLLSPRGIVITLLALCAGLSLSSAQITFQKAYGGPYPLRPRAFSVQQTSDSGYIIGGNCDHSDASDRGGNFYVLKTNSTGDSVWMKRYGDGYAGEYGWSVVQTSDGGYIGCGYDHYLVEGWQDIYLIKMNSTGDTLWTKTYGENRAQAFSIQQTSDGGYIIAGSFNSLGANKWDVYLLKTDSFGDTLWTRTYGGLNDDFAYSVQLTSDGGYIIGGAVDPQTSYLIRTNSSGDTVWTRTYGFGQAWSVQQTSDGGFIFTGIGGIMCLVKTNSSGDTLWTRNYDQLYGTQGYSVQQTSDGGYIFAGELKTSPFVFTKDYLVYLIKTNSSGDTLWTRTYGGHGDHVASSVRQTYDGGYIIAGAYYTSGVPPGGQDSFAYLIKTRADGFVASVEKTVNIPPAGFALQQNYPNPFNPSTRISYALPQRSYVTLTVFNTLGQLVATLVNGEIDAGYHDVTFNVAGLASGVYFYRMQAGSFVQTKRLVVLR